MMIFENQADMKFNSCHNNVVAQKDFIIATAEAAYMQLQSVAMEGSIAVQRFAEQMDIIMRKDIEIFQLKDQKTQVEEKLRVCLQQLDNKKIEYWALNADYDKTKKTLEANHKAGVELNNALISAKTWGERKEYELRKVIEDHEKEISRRDRAAAPPSIEPEVERNNEALGPPYRFLQHAIVKHRSCTMNTRKKRENNVPKRTNTPKTISKSRQGRSQPACQFLKTLGVTSLVGLVGMAGERGYLW